MLKAGVIGCGSISHSHFKAYEQIGNETKNVRVEAVCDIRPERMENRGNVRKYTDIDAFLAAEAEKLDYVDICLPTYLHAETAMKALKAGFHVLCEKPMALNREQAESMCNAARETGKTLMIAHCMRFMGANRIAKQLVDSGELGRVIDAEFYREGGNWNPMGYQNWFRDEKRSGGAMLDLHIHDVDIIYQLFGMPKAVSAVGASVIPGATGYDAMSVNYLYENGMFVNAKCNWSIRNDHFNTRAFRINFENGYIFMDRSKDRQTFVKVYADGRTEDLWEQIDLNFYYNEICYFARCLETAAPVSECLPEDSVQAVRLIMAERESADRGGEKVLL